MYQRFRYPERPKWLLALLLTAQVGMAACSSSSDEPPAADDPDANPTKPDNLSFSVHSAYEVELFWTASNDDGRVSGYDIIRDDVIIKELSNATRFFDGTLAPSSTYEFQVVAVDDKGNRSSPSVIDVTTPVGQASNYSINESTFSSILASVFDVFTGRGVYAQRLYELPGFSNTSHEDETVACDNEGTATITAIYEGYGPGRAVTFDNCQDGSSLLDGQIDTYYFTSEWVVANDFRIVGPSGTETLSGSIHRYGGLWVVSNIDYELISDESRFHLTSNGFTWSRAMQSSRSFYLTMSGEFAVESDAVASGALLRVSADLATGMSPDMVSEYIDDGSHLQTDLPELLKDIYFHSGSLSVSAADGSSVLMDPATGDTATAAITLSSPEGSESLLRDWAIWERNLQSDVVGFLPN